MLGNQAGRDADEPRAGDGARRVDATANCGHSITPTRSRNDHSGSNRNISPSAVGGKPVAYSGCSRTPGRRSSARCSSDPTAKRKRAAGVD